MIPPAPRRDTSAGRAYNDLRNLARRQNRDTAEYITLYALEGFLTRLSASDSVADPLVFRTPMAGQIVEVDMADDDLLPAWRTVIELADSGVSRHWTLVGGLMVDAHARRSNVVMPRPTEDVDVLVDYDPGSQAERARPW